MYNPQLRSFPGKTIQLLYYTGVLKNEVIRETIGLNEFCEGSIYSDRSSYYFSRTLIRRLLYKGVVERVKTGYYRLTPEWRDYYPEWRRRKALGSC